MKPPRLFLPILLPILLITGCTHTTIDGTFVPTSKKADHSPSIQFSGLMAEVMGGSPSAVFENGTVDISLLPMGPHSFEIKEDKIWVSHPVVGTDVPFFRIRDTANVVDIYGSIYRLSGSGEGAREKIDWFATGFLILAALSLAIATPILAARFVRRPKGNSQPVGISDSTPRPLIYRKPPTRPPKPSSDINSGKIFARKPSDIFLSKTEKHCLTELARAGGERLLIFPKVHLGRFSGDTKGSSPPVIDLLLCDPDSLEPFAAIQLVDNREKERSQWRALQYVLQEEGILFEMISPTTFYSPHKIEKLISEILEKAH